MIKTCRDSGAYGNRDPRMSRRQNPAMPSTPFGLLLVEGGDELAVCQILGDRAWSQLCAWKADGRDLPGLARLAQNDPNFLNARSVGIVLDVEGDVAAAHLLAAEAVAVLGGPRAFVPGVFGGSPRIGVFLIPDGSTVGALETLCRRAIRDHILAALTTSSCAVASHTRKQGILKRSRTRAGSEPTWECCPNQVCAFI